MTLTGRVVPQHPAAAWRWAVAWRVVLAIGANYALCALVAAAAGRWLPRLGVARIEAAAAGDLVAIVLLPVIPIFVFAARSAWRPALAMGGAIAALALAVWAVGPPA
jgi:hypothetical protein